MNTQPIDTAGLATALERSASSMSAAGNTLEETMAIIASANSVVQDPAAIGTALKTISMRIRGKVMPIKSKDLSTALYKLVAQQLYKSKGQGQPETQERLPLL